jgi:hypothetical protein
MDEQEAELRNPFPSPPSHYTNYTTHNLALLALLNERTDPTSSESQSQQQVLSDCTDVPDWSLRQLEKPRVDWILEDGHYNVFGDTWFVSVHSSVKSRQSLIRIATGERDNTISRRLWWPSALSSRSFRW